MAEAIPLRLFQPTERVTAVVAGSLVRVGEQVLHDSPVIRPDALRFEPRKSRPAPPPERAAKDPRNLVDLRGRTLEELEAIAIRAAFDRHRGNR
jgi:hypothetical protein